MTKGGGGGAMDPNVSSKSGKPQTNFWCRWIANKTGLMFAIFLSCHIGSLAITGILFGAGYNIFPFVFDGLPLAMQGETLYLRHEAWSHRRNDLQTNNTNNRKRRSLDSSSLVSAFERPMQSDILDSGEIKLNLQESLQEQLSKIDPTAAAVHLLGLGLQHGKEIDPSFNFLGQELTKKIETLDLFSQVEQCCDLSSFSGWKLSKSQCWCNPHGSLKDNQPNVFHSHSGSRQKRDVEVVDHLDERRKTLTSITLIYEDPNGNVFTKENLQKIAKFEYALYQAEDYKTKYCKTFQMSSAIHCQPFTSILRFFDGTYTNEDDKFFDPSFTDIKGVLFKAKSIESMSDILSFHLAKDAIVDNTTGTITSSRTRSMVYYGYPYTKYINSDDRSDRRIQQNIWTKYARKTLKPLFVDIYQNGFQGLDFYYVSRTLYWDEALQSVTGDLLWLFAGFAFIYLFMLFQTGSFWITSFGMASILSTFFAANLIYNVVVGYKYFGIFNVLALFIVLGIGADDIFIFSDTWKLYATTQFDSLEERVAVVFKRASMAMFVTSLTTMVAFFVSSFSPLLAISGFGTYAGLCIFINYLSVISFFPCVVVLYHKHFEKNLCCCCGTREAYKPSYNISPRPETPSAWEDDSRPSSRGSSGMPNVEKVEGSSANLQPSERFQASGTDRINALIVKFFATNFFSFVTHKVVRIVILILFAGFMALCLYSSLQVQMDNSDLKLFDPNTIEERSNAKNTYDFKATLDEPTMDITVAWGLGLQDLSTCQRLEYNAAAPCEGTTRFVEEFTLEDEASQMSLLNWCKKMRNSLDETTRDKLQISYSKTTKQNSIECFIIDMETFYKDEHLQPQYPAGTSLALPITLEKMKTIMTYNPKVYDPSTISSMTRPFEMAINFWLTHRYTNDTIPDNRNKHSSSLGLRKIKTIDFSAVDSKKIYEAKLMYVGVEIATIVPTQRISLMQAVPLQAEWEAFINSEVEQMTPPLRHGFQFARLWVWINILSNLSTQSFSAFGIGLLLAFVVIFLGTQNIITGFVATLMLACVTCAVIAVMPVAGWKFGLLEGLNFCLIVGLAVDYIVHLAEGYHMSSYTGRLDRIRDTLERVGISILSGALTTLGASFFMLFARILFFKQFGIFMFCTIGCSMIFALFVMLAAYSIFGPEGYFASFVPLCRDRAKYKEHKEQPVAHENAAYEGDTANKDVPT